MYAAIALLATACLAQAAHVPVHTADKAYLIKQKSIYELFWHVDQPTVYHPELYQKARSFSLADHLDQFVDKTVVEELLQRLKHGMLPRGHVFTAAHKELHQEAVCLFRVLYGAKDFDTFYNTAVWARFHVNEQMYVYALSVAVMHRPDTKHIHLPPVYEILPNFFFNTDVLHQAYHVAMGHAADQKTTMGGVNYNIINANYSGWYMHRDNVPDQQLSYFTEDVGLNAYYFLVNHDFPEWMNSAEYNMPKDIRGELYFYGHKQLLVRYYLERLSNDMGEIEHVDIDRRIPVGYYPTMHYQNGLPFPQREVMSAVPLKKHDYVRTANDLHVRISSAIDTGYVIDTNGKHVSIYTPEGLNMLGNIVQGNADSINRVFYGHMDKLCRVILGFGLEPVTKYQVVPSALEIYSTSMRDPVFYSMYKNILHYFHRYKANMKTYTHEELVFPGVKVESVTVDKLMTYFDNFESLLNNAVSVRSHKDAQDVLIKARQHRLNHKPFTYHITVNSDKNVKAMVRIFMGPKYDVHGHELDISENYMNFMELDQWVVDLKTGINKIERNSHESVYVVPDQVPSEVFYKKVVKAMENPETFTYSHQNHGFPDRLVLPKGKKEGMPFKLFVCVTHFDDAKATKIESPIWGTTLVDGRAMGYPLDRPVHAHDVTVPNMYFKDVLVFHKQMQEINLPA
ncbi:hypothetical protein KM043_011832 [Ampulex compressa]|nr:hypothetical protein KM043_011832 [Ampulex compressa]